jgi:hypothetical protein
MGVNGRSAATGGGQELVPTVSVQVLGDDTRDLSTRPNDKHDGGTAPGNAR